VVITAAAILPKRARRAHNRNPTPETVLPACPLCAKALSQEIIHGVTIDVCPEHGVWLDRGELLLITEGERFEVGQFSLSDLLREAIQPPVDSNRVLSCPICSKSMGLERYQDVHLDRCVEHGIWLDTGELKALLSNLRLDPLYRRGASIRLWEARF